MRHPVDWIAYGLLLIAAVHVVITTISAVWRRLELGDHMRDLLEGWLDER